MNTRRAFSIITLFVLAITVVACASAPTPVPAAPPPTQAPPTPAPLPTAVPTPAPAAFDVKSILDKYVTSYPDTWGAVMPAGLKDQMATAKPFILDVREPGEIAQNGFIEGSVNIPLRTLTKNLDKLPAKDQPIVTVCPVGQKGGTAMVALQLLGYTNVKNLIGGFNAWKAANLPVATGSPAAPVAGKAPDLDKDLFAVVDQYITTLPANWGAVMPAGLKDEMATTKPTLIDVREPSDIAQNGKIEGSVNIPIRTLVKNLDKLPADKAAPIVTYCPVGQKGVIAMGTLQLLGYSNVRNLIGGFGGWTAANLPIVK